MPKQIVMEAKDNIFKIIYALSEKLKNELSSHIHPNMIIHHTVFHDGKKVKLMHIASVTLDGSSLKIKPWDQSALKNIEKSLSISNDFGFIISCRGDGAVTLDMPLITKEKRAEWSQMAKQLGDEAKISVRALRSKYKAMLEALKNTEGVSLNALFKEKKSLDRLICESNAQIDAMVKEKQHLLKL